MQTIVIAEGGASPREVIREASRQGVAALKEDVGGYCVGWNVSCSRTPPLLGDIGDHTIGNRPCLASKITPGLRSYHVLLILMPSTMIFCSFYSVICLCSPALIERVEMGIESGTPAMSGQLVTR